MEKIANLFSDMKDLWQWQSMSEAELTGSSKLQNVPTAGYAQKQKKIYSDFFLILF